MAIGSTAGGRMRSDAEKVEELAHWLDRAYRIPFTNIRFGWDPILGLLPGIGDAASAAISVYILLEARRQGVPTGTIVRMLGNVGIDALLGSVPLIGTIFDVWFRANDRNLALLREHLQRPPR